MYICVRLMRPLNVYLLRIEETAECIFAWSAPSSSVKYSVISSYIYYLLIVHIATNLSQPHIYTSEIRFTRLYAAYMYFIS